MASNFDRWENDPFFSAAEEVQESADRMESAYRRWIHERKDASEFVRDSEELCRELHTALGTAKWQLEEFERASQLNDMGNSVEDTRTRHCQFIVAIENQISRVENSLRESMLEEGKTTLPWVRLDEGERNELALFLSGPSRDGERIPAAAAAPFDEKEEKLQLTNGEIKSVCSKASCHSVEFGSQETREEKRLHGHRRTASASADIGVWKIAVADERGSFHGQPDISSSKIPSISGFIKPVELASKLKWSKNGFRKWKGGDRHQAADTEPLRAHQLSRGINACYERSKSCLDSCSDESYDKQLYGWLGAVQRQLQRSQYQIQYSRPVQAVFLVVLGICLIILFVRHTL